MGLEETKVNRVSRMVLNLMRLEVLLGIALILWTLSLAAETNEYECPSSMENILKEQSQAADDLDFERLRFYTACHPKTVNEQPSEEEYQFYAEKRRLAEEKMKSDRERLAEIEDARNKNQYSLIAKIYRRDEFITRATNISAPQATQLNTRLLTLYQQLLIEQNDKMLKQNEQIIELLEGMQSN
jgi:hypothetical protein